MFRSLLTASSLVLLSGLAAATVSGPGSYYVTTNETHERLSPDPKAKSTNVLFKRQRVDVLEVKGDWARVSKFYDGGGEGMSGQVARWVTIKDLDAKRPAEEKLADGGSVLSVALKDSDNFAKHQKVFVIASQKLINDGTCQISDFKKNGGWSKSSKFAPREVYFTYCGDNSTIAGRIYLDAANGTTFR